MGGPLHYVGKEANQLHCIKTGGGGVCFTRRGQVCLVLQIHQGTWCLFSSLHSSKSGSSCLAEQRFFSHSSLLFTKGMFKLIHTLVPLACAN